jgi:hypothetical protein
VVDAPRLLLEVATRAVELRIATCALEEDASLLLQLSDLLGDDLPPVIVASVSSAFWICAATSTRSYAGAMRLNPYGAACDGPS